MQSADQEKRDRNLDTILIVILIFVILGLAFQFYGRFAYVTSKGQSVTRIDRLTGDTCVLPCTQGRQNSDYVIEPNVTHVEDAKKCHQADIVRVASAIRIPPSLRPVPYNEGGFESSSNVVRHWRQHLIPYASELSDGHIYVFSPSSFLSVSTWSTGDSVQVCATWSKIEKRPFYSVGGSEEAVPATIAI